MKGIMEMHYELLKVIGKVNNIYIRNYDDVVAAFRYTEKVGSAHYDVYVVTLINGVEIKISCDQLLDDLERQDPPCRVEHFKTSRSVYRPFMEVDL